MSEEKLITDVLIYYPSYRYPQEVMVDMIGNSFCPAGPEPPIDFGWIKANVQPQVNVEYADGMTDDPVNLDKYGMVIFSERMSRYKCYPPYPSEDVLNLQQLCNEHGIPTVNATGFEIDTPTKINIGFHNILSFMTGLPHVYDLNYGFDFSDIDFSKYSQNKLLPGMSGGDFGMFATSVGCPYNCSFCTAQTLCPGRPKYMQAELIVEGFDQLDQAGVKKLFFIDDTFTENEKHLKVVTSLLKEYDFECEIQTRVDCATKENMKQCSDAGIVECGFGVEHVNSNILRQCGKHYTKRTISNALNWSSDAGMSTMMFVVMCLPGETHKTFEEVMDFVGKHKFLTGSGAQIGTPLPGSRLYQQGIDEGKLKTPYDIILDAGTIGTPFETRDVKNLWYFYNENISIPNYLDLFEEYYYPGIRKAFEEKWID